MFHNSVIGASAILALVLSVGCDTVPESQSNSSVTLSCSELSKTVIACNNGWTYNQIGDVGASEDGGAGGAGGEGGSGGVGGETETPSGSKYFMCFAPPVYPGIGAACTTSADCPPAGSGCEIPTCNNGVCTLKWAGDGAKMCNDDDLYCVGSYCCGLVQDPN